MRLTKTLKKKKLLVSIVIFLTVFSIETIDFDYTIGDHSYYTTIGGLGQGHDLTLIVLRPMYLVLPSFLRDAALPIFVNFMFVLSVYFMLKPFIRYPEWAFILAPITPLATVYAQIFAISLFNLMLGFYFRAKQKLEGLYRLIALLFLVLIFLAHYWTGLFVAGIFVLYLLVFDRKSKSLLPSILIAGIFFLFISQPIGFLTDTQNITPEGYLTTAGFFFLISRGLSFFFLSFAGLGILYRQYQMNKKRFYVHLNFFRINLMLFLIPFLIVFCLPTSDYWDWRLFYFMPFLALVSVLMSYLFTKKVNISGGIK